MEPKVSEYNGGRAPLAVWGSETPGPDTPSEVYKTPQSSPLVLHRAGSPHSSPTYPASPRSVESTYLDAADPNYPIPYVDEPPGLATDTKSMTSEVRFLPSPTDGDSIASSSENDDDEEEERSGKTVYPDGGWGWMVVGCSMVISMVADGISFSLGLMLNEFVSAFGESQAKTAWIGGLFMAVPLLSGPVMSAFVDRYGCRVGTIVGGLISGVGFITAIFGNSVEYEYMTFGVIAGLGLGLCYVTAVVSVCQWFEKKRALATGLGAAGTGFGTFVYAPMTQYFIEEYGWRGATLLLSGTFFNMCICGALMRDPPYMLVQKEEKRAESLATKSLRNASSYNSVSGLESLFPGSGEIRSMLRSGRDPQDILTSLTEGARITDEARAAGDVRVCHSVVDLPTHLRLAVTLDHILEDEGLTSCRSASDQGKLNLAGATKVPFRCKKSPRDHPTHPNQFTEAAQPLLSQTAEPAMAAPTPVSGLSKAKTFFQKQFSFEKSAQSNYLKHVRVHRNSIMYRGATMTTGRYHLKASSCPNIFRNSMTTLAREQEEKWYTECVELIKTIFNFSYFLEFHFFLTSMGVIMLFTFFIVPYFYLTPLMVANGFTAEDGSLVLAYIGLVNAVGMILFGWIGDQPWVNVSKLFAWCMVICGVSCIATPLVVTNYWVLNLTVWCFALTFASSYSLTPVLIVELIPVEKFTTAYGLILLCQGIGNLVGPSIAGAICDHTGSWDISFYLAGGGIIMSGLLIGIIPYTENFMMVGKGKLEMDNVSQA